MSPVPVIASAAAGTPGEGFFAGEGGGGDPGLPRVREAPGETGRVGGGGESFIRAMGRDGAGDRTAGTGAALSFGPTAARFTGAGIGIPEKSNGRISV
ncbi:MAG TPA: hypothetical protein QF870_07255 [Nitrospinota bacterium]|nr:hypothetical protein [Nitrospinota bacterium]